MADLVLISVTLGFIALCVGYISWCDRIIGPDDFGADASTSASASAPVSASAPDAVAVASEVTA